MSAGRVIPQRKLPDVQSDQSRRDHAQAIEAIRAVVAKIPEAARNYLGRQIITRTSRYAPTPGTRAVLLKVVGGGGGGGGASGGGDFAMAGGGWSGLYSERYIAGAGAVTGGAVTIGAAGAAGAAASQGGTGGTTSAVINGRTYSAPGGAGGLGMSNGAGAAVTGVPSTAGGVTTGADLNIQDAGDQGMRISAGNGWAGAGGSTPAGSGGVTTATGNGGAANVGYGGGGGGAIAGPSNQTGGLGGAGVVIIEEFS